MLKSLKPVIQRPQDLILAVATDDSLPAITALKSATIAHDAWHIRFDIIGESHRIQVSHQQAPILCEMLACITLSEDTNASQHAFTDLANYDYQQQNYSIAVKITRHQTAPQPHHASLMYTFPAIGNISPITRITWSLTPQAITWHTLHTYTQQDKPIYVYSHSHFSFHTEEPS